MNAFHIGQDGAQFIQVGTTAFAQIRGRLEQLLIDGHLPRRREQQRGHRFVAAHDALGGVLRSDAQRGLGELLAADVSRCVAQDVGDDFVGLEERAQHGVGHQRPLGPQQGLDGIAARIELGFPILDPLQLLGHVGPEGGRVGEVELELQQCPQAHGLSPERVDPFPLRGAAGVHERQFHDRGLQERVDQRVAVERRLEFLFRGDPPDRFVPAVDPGHRMSVGQGIQGRADAVIGMKAQGAVGHRRLLALQIVQRVLQGVVELTQGQRPASRREQDRRDQRGGVDRSRPLNPPGDLDRHLLHGQPLRRLVLGDRAGRVAEVLAHRDRFGEADVDLAVVALTLGFDEVHQPLRPLGDLLPAAGVGGVLGCLVQLVEADRRGLQKDVLTAAVQVGVGDVRQQSELGRQHLSGARSGALDGPAEVEALLHDVADELAQHVLVQRVVELAAQEDDARSAHQRTHETKRQVDSGEGVRRRQFVLLQRHRHDDAVEVGPVRPQQHRGMIGERQAHSLDLRGVVIDARVEAAAENGPAQVRNQIDGEPAPAGGELVEHHLGLLRGSPRNALQALDETGRGQQLVGQQARRLVFGSEQTQFDAFDREIGPAQHESGEIQLTLADDVFVPLTAQFRDLGRIAGDHPGAGRILLEDRPLQDLRGPVGLAARNETGQFHPGGQSARNPEHPHRNHGAVLGGVESCGEIADQLRRGVAVRNPQHLDTGVGVRAALGRQPVVEEIGFGFGGHRGEHQRVIGGAEVGEVIGGTHRRPLTLFSGAAFPDGSEVSVAGALSADAFLAAAFFAGAFLVGAFLAAAFFAGGRL